MGRPTAAQRQARRRARLAKRARAAEQLHARRAAEIERLGGFDVSGEFLHCPHYIAGAPVSGGWLVMLPEVAVCPGCVPSLPYLVGPSLAWLLRAVAG